MKKLAILIFLMINSSCAQLNYDGNPLTEDTEYAAEESQFSQKIAKQENHTTIVNQLTKHSQKLYPIIENDSQKSHSVLTDTAPLDLNIETSRKFSQNVYNQMGNTAISPAEAALNVFLNSKTPEESHHSLDTYLRNRQLIKQSEQTETDLLKQAMPRMDQIDGMAQTNAQISQQAILQSPVSQVNRKQMELTSYTNQRQPVSQADQKHQLQQLQQQRQSNIQTYNYVDQTQDPRLLTNAAAPLNVDQHVAHSSYIAEIPTVQLRNDFIPVPMWRQRIKRIRGKPHSIAQPRLSSSLHKGPIAAQFRQNGPVEIIYTRPPGFHRGPPPLSNPPIMYEDASAWFPNVDHPPPSKDIYYSQLYAQSYDPYYYNYIAKTGKIKPHLYGKLGKRHEDEDNGIWSELYKGFKKHGLKNLMTPTFLLGMTLPVVTLMLTALVQKRSVGRSDSGNYAQENAIQEYLERLQKAMECYDINNRKIKDAKAVAKSEC